MFGLPGRVGLLGTMPKQSGVSAEALVSALVLAGAGAIYTPSDLTSLYQSRTGGSTGATGQPVGIMLDKSYMGGQTAAAFIAAQAEKLSNGSFASGSTGWTVNNADGTHIVTFSGGTCRFQSDTTTPVLQVQQSSVLTVGNWYAITTVCSAWTSGAVKMDVSGASPDIAAGVGTTVVVGRATNTHFIFYRTSPNVDLTIDSISVKEIPGFHALAPSDAARPTLTVAGSLAYLTADGVDDWMNVTPTLNLGEAWWHVGGWRNDTAANGRAFATSNRYEGSLWRNAGNWNWVNSAGASASLAGSPASIGVVTVEQTATAGTLTLRQNGVQTGSMVPFDDSASTQGLAFFSQLNSAFNSGMAGCFYGGAFVPGTITGPDRSIVEAYIAVLAGVTL